MSGRRDFLAALLALAAHPALAAEGDPLLEVKSESPFPADLATLERRYAALVRYLAEDMRVPYRLLVTASQEVREQPMNSVLVASPIFIKRALSFGYTPVAQSNAKDRIVFVARASSKFPRLAQYKGTRLGLPAQGSQGEFMARKALSRGSIAAEQFFGAISYASAQETALKALRAGVIDLAAVSERGIPQGEPDIAKLLVTPPFAVFGIAIRSVIGHPGFERARKALFLPSEDGRRAIEEAGLTPLDPMDAAFFAATT
jgi:hypothetical protein